MITSLNLALSNYCSADCVFCPHERGKRDHTHMPPFLVEKLLSEVSSSTFPWKVKTVQTGENGDAFLNPHYLRILRMIRAALPDAKVNLGTNLLSVRREGLETILSERLLDGLQLNIDGHDAESYHAQKRAPYSRVIENLRNLVEARAKYWSDFPITIHVLPLVEYVAEVRRRFNCAPVKRGDRPVPFSSFALVKESLSWLPKDIRIDHASIFCWAERSQPGANSGKYNCPQLDRMLTEAFISPSGLWYPCCMDANQDLVYGSVAKNTLIELHDSPKRMLFLQKVQDGRLEEVGQPCTSSYCCLGYSGFIRGN